MQRGRKSDQEAPFFGKRLAFLRQQKGMTQYELAEALGISRDLVGHYERRSKNPNLDFVLKTADLFGITVDELLGIKAVPQKTGPTPKISKLIEQISDLPKNKQSFVLEMLESYIEKAS